MAEISHLIADSDTNAKLKACFPDFTLLKEQVKKRLVSDLELAQALIVSPEISDVPEPTRFLFLLFPQANDRSQISCRGYCYLGDRERFFEYLKMLLESKVELDIDNPIYISNFHRIDPAQIFSSLSLVDLREEVAKEKSNDLSRRELAGKITSKNFPQLAFIALILFAIVYAYASPQAQVLIGKTRDYVFGFSSFFTGTDDPSLEPAMSGLDQNFSSVRARYVGNVEAVDHKEETTQSSNPRDSIDILLGKLEQLESQEKAKPEEIEKIEAEIDKAFEMFAEKEDGSDSTPGSQ